MYAYSNEGTVRPFAFRDSRVPKPSSLSQRNSRRGAVAGAGRTQAVRQATQQVGALLKGVPSICGHSGRGNNWAHGTKGRTRVVALVVV